MIQNRERAFQAFHDVHVLHGRLVHVRVFLDRQDQIGNARRAAFDFVQQAHDLDRRADSNQRRAGRAGIERPEQFFQRLRLNISARKTCRKLPQIVLSMAAQQGIQLFFQFAHRQRVGRRFILLGERGFQFLDLRFLRGSKLAPSQIVARVADAFQNIAQLAGGAFGGGSGIVEFVSEPRGKFSERSEAVSLLFPARGLADPVGHHAHEALGQLGHFLHEVVILRFWISQDVAVGQRAGAERECFHS